MSANGGIEWANWALVLIGFLTLGTILYQSIKTAVAANATKDAVVAANKARKLTEDTSKVELRAYLTVKGAKLVLRDDGMAEPRVTFINTGQTPAHELQGIECIRFDQSPFSEAPPPPPEMAPISMGSVGGGQPYYFTGRPVMASEDRLRLLREEHEAYAYRLNGWYTYRDVFNVSHTVKFQLRIGGGAPVQKGKDENGEYLIFFNDSVGNESD